MAIGRCQQVHPCRNSGIQRRHGHLHVFAPISIKIGVVLTACLVSGSATLAQSMLEQLPLPRGYQPLDYPRDFGDASLAGSLVQLSRGKGFRPLGHLRDCGLPDSATKPLSGLLGLTSVSRKTLRMEGSVTASFLRLFGLELKGDADRQAEISLQSATEEYIVPLAVVSAARANDAVLRQRCGNLLKLSNVYWINSAIKVDRIRLRLLNSAGGRLGGSAQELGAYVSGLDAKAGVSVSSDGEIDIRKPVYIAFRDAPPAELLTGEIQLQSVGASAPFSAVEYGDEIYAQP